MRRGRGGIKPTQIMRVIKLNTQSHQSWPSIYQNTARSSITPTLPLVWLFIHRGLETGALRCGAIHYDYHPNSSIQRGSHVHPLVHTKRHANTIPCVTVRCQEWCQSLVLGRCIARPSNGIHTEDWRGPLGLHFDTIPEWIWYGTYNPIDQ